MIFDEFQDLLVAREDLDGLLRSHIQYHGDAAAYVYAGLGAVDDARLFERGSGHCSGRRIRWRSARSRSTRCSPISPSGSARGANPGEALGELAVFAAASAARDAARYLLAEQLEAGRPGTVETAETVVEDALERTQAAHRRCGAS